MAEYLIQSETLDAIVEAINQKAGTQNTMTPADMVIGIQNFVVRQKETWHQDTEPVRNYMANVDYTDVPYTSSQIGIYAPDPPVTSNSKPVGKSVDSITFYNNVPRVETPFSLTNAIGTLKPLDQVRWINSRTNNMRDLGGWACDGGTVKYGLIYRSGELNALDEDLLINELGINTEVDLTADGTPAFPGKMRFIGHTSYAMYSLADTGAWYTNLKGIFDAVIYHDPVIFHCSMGADRTGTMACILEALLGVSQSDIDKDYELTSFHAIRARNGNYQGGTSDWAHLIAQIEALSGDTFRDKAVTFARSVGITTEEINAYRHAMIDGNPEDIVEVVNLFDPDDADVTIRGRLNSSGAAIAYADDQLVTGFIPASDGDVFRIETDKSLTTNGYTGMVAYYDSSKAYKAQTGNANKTVWAFSNSDMTGVCTLLSTVTGVGYVRFCIAYTDIDNIKIYKQ